MPLPKNDVPIYTIKLPSNGQQVKFRPFLVKEQKVLLIALESENDDEIATTLINTLESCLMDKINVTKMPIFDFEYLYLQIRAKSVGEIVKLKLKCHDEENTYVDYDLNVDDVKLDKPISKENTIKFSENYGLVMKYPTVRSFSKAGSTTEVNFALITDAIQSVYKDDQVFDTDTVSEQEITEFVESLTQDQYNKVIEFINNMPRLSHIINYKNPNTGKEFKLNLQGMKDFF